MAHIYCACVRSQSLCLVQAIGSTTISSSQAQGSFLCDFGVHDVTSAAASLFCRPPPKLPDLIAAFSDSLRQSVALQNVSKRLFDTVSTCRVACRAGRCLDAYDCADTSPDVPCRRNDASQGSLGRHLQHSPPVSGLQPPRATTRRTPQLQIDSEVNARKQPFYSNREVGSYRVYK